ncbi:MAG: hypothetical protein HON70_43045 [Lentisphaerae bacterium]|nr:hypothetical protein [Lentisphaerota bacterium]
MGPGDDTGDGTTPTDDGQAATGQETNQDVEEAAQGVVVTLPSGYFIGQDRQRDWVYGVEDPDEVSVDVNVKQGTVSHIEGGRADLVTESNTSPSPNTSRAPAPPPPPEPPELYLVITPDSQLELSAEKTANTDVVVAEGSSISVAQETKSYMVWGYWGMKYHAPNDASKQSQVSGVWAATDLLKTSVEHLRNALLGGDFTGTYTGDAHCLVDPADSANAQLTPLDGTAHLQVDFAQKTFSGGYDFTADQGPQMQTAGDVGETGLLGRVTGISSESVTKSGVRGTFYDTDASKVIGSFNAVTPENVYIGVFGVQGTVSPNASE